MYNIEVGENQKSSVCHCCSRESIVGNGYIFKNDDAYSIYFSGWAPSHPDKKVSIAISIGDWDDNSTSDHRVCFGLEVNEGENEILYRLIDPDESPWPNTDILGKMISREDSLNHPLIKEVFLIAEKIVYNHGAVKQYLSIP